MATGLYWCLVLTECLSLVVVSAVSFTQTTPPDSTPVCPGGRLVFTCVSNGIAVYWKRSDKQGVIVELTNMSRNTNINDLLLNITNITNNTIISIGTIESVAESMNGTMISCSAEFAIDKFKTLSIIVKG